MITTMQIDTVVKAVPQAPPNTPTDLFSPPFETYKPAVLTENHLQQGRTSVQQHRGKATVRRSTNDKSNS